MPEKNQISRSKLTKIRIAVLLAALILFVWAFIVEPGLLFQKDISLTKWQGPDFKVAFLSDLHAGAPHITKKYIENLISRINANNPDVILIGGDLVINGVIGGTPMPIAEVAELLKNLKSKFGVYAVLGNHDWWSNGAVIAKTLEQNGIAVLDNKAKLIEVTSEHSLWLVGIGDDYTHHAQPDVAFSQVSTEAPKLLFMHDPAALFQVKNPFMIALAGHMHGGQVFIPGIGALITPGKAPKEWARGWVDFEFGSLFVSQGIGTSIFPVRFNAPPEYVILHLKRPGS